VRPINVCVTVFNRYDLLAVLVDSLRKSSVVPSALYVIDRGNDARAVDEALGHGVSEKTDIRRIPLEGQCLATAWNWFIKNVPEERIIASDDIVFYPETLGVFRDTPGDFIGIKDGKSSAFACFLIRDSCVEKIGLFDETISPDYLYFEDCDYGKRMHLAGVPIVRIDCLFHANSQSLARKTEEQTKEHHRLFTIAQENYIRKWGSAPTPGEW